MTKPTFVGIDPSLTATGVAIVPANPAEMPSVERYTSKGKTLDRVVDRWVRLSTLAIHVVAAVPPNSIVAIETPAHDQTSGHHHDRSGLWWLILDGLLQREDVIAVLEVSTSQVKKYATGRGNASKMEVMAAAIKRYGAYQIRDDNEADAVVIAAFIARAQGEPIEESMPQAHLAALDKFTPADVGEES